MKSFCDKSNARAIIHGSHQGDIYRMGRTLRSLKAAGISGEFLPESVFKNLADHVEAREPLFLMRAGTWLRHTEEFRLPSSSATGKGLCAYGVVKIPREFDTVTGNLGAAWQKLLSGSGGDLGALGHRAAREHFSGNSTTISFPSLYLDSRAVATLAERKAFSLEEVIRIAFEEFRFVHVPVLDVYDDRGLRVIQLITALHRGGAERVTLDLLKELPGQDVRVKLATVGRPLRDSHALPPGTLDVAAASRSAEDRMTFLLRAATAFGADLIHGHLISRPDICSISEGGFPVVLSVHNMQQGWPRGLTELRANEATLLVACAQAVERDVISAGISIPVRTVRNGIDLKAFQRTPERIVAGKKLRLDWGFGEQDFVLVSVANPRPQKRLHLLPLALAALRARLGGVREARLILCGEPLPGNPDAERSVRDISAEISRLGLEPHVRWLGSVTTVAEILAAANVLVSTSAHEGLSLAQLEALAMELPVVATDVGGAREIARINPAFHLVPAEAAADHFADKLFVIATEPPGEISCVEASNTLKYWSRWEMSARYRWLYPRAIAASRRAGSGRGIWLIANNFSTGGAQSSARRLLMGLAAEGVRVRAAVVEENPDYPTPGRAALLQSGIPTLAVSPTLKITTAVEEILEAIDSDPPRAVVFWNLRPSFKVLLADALVDVPVFDVSPGEMFFDSLNKYFAEHRSSLPYHCARDYGARLAGVIVKYRAEAQRAAQALGAPVHVIPNGVPLRPFQTGGLNRRASRMSFTTAARINPQKRLEDLLEAFHFAHPRLPEYTLKIAGGVEGGCDDYASSLRSMADGLPVEWMGEVTDVAGFHRQSDLFVMISEPAGCPNASLEAMAAGLPIVATDVGGVSEQVIDRRTGRLVPPRDAKAFAEAVVELATQPGLRQDMGAAAHNHVRDRFALERMVADYRRVLLPDRL